MADLIDRGAVKRELNAQYAIAKNTANPDAVEQVLKEIDRSIDSFPAVNRWIPCSERMPENLQTVIAVWVNHKPEPYYSEIKDKPFTAPCIYYNGEWFWWSSCCEDYLAEYGRADFDKIDDAVEITHWMPLPEPPKTEED